MNVIFHTLGCKVNQYETQAIRELFIKKGFTCDDKGNGDIIVINSCSVTAESDRKTRQTVRRFRKQNENSVIVLTGCMVQAFPSESAKIEEADIVIGNKDIKDIPCLVQAFLSDKKRIVIYDEHKTGDSYITPAISDFDERTRAYMKIEDGCDRFCSYCIIPYSRGRVRSRDLEDIKAEAQRLANKGYSEIVLVGINLSAYGKGTDKNICDAVDVVSSIDGIKRVRLGSLEPDHITDEMLNRLKSNGKFCPQFHLSLQSGCDETLKRMNRHYDSAFYLDLVNRIRNIFEDAAITTDIMVGFAGETQEEFNKSLDFAKKVGFARAHIFPYSRRSGTVAAALKTQVENFEKTRRAKLMAQATQKSEQEFLLSQIGKIYPVLFETMSDNYAVGYTENYVRVKVPSEKSYQGEILAVKLTQIDNDSIIGEFID